MDWPYQTGCFKNGLLDEVDAVSVHPYRTLDAGEHDCRLPAPADSIDYYARDRHLPILSTEFGMTTWGGGETSRLNEQRQAAMLARYWLVHYYLGIPAVFFATQDAGTKPNVYDQHFGFLRADFSPNRPTPPPEPQPLPGRLPLLGRVAAESEDDWLLLFEKQENGSAASGWRPGPPACPTP